MKTIKKIITSFGNPIWVGVLILIVSIVVIISASRILYTQTVELLTENLRQRILTISITVAANTNASDLEALQNEEDWTKPEWAKVVNRLNRAKYSNDDIVFMYIFRKTAEDPTQMEFVADADSINPYANSSGDPSQYVDVNRDGKVEPDGPDKLQWPGQLYPEAVDIPEAFEAYNGPLTSSELYTDEYGTVLTGYAPIKNESGEVVAVLATDIKADDFFTITTQTLRPFLIFIVFLTFVITILTVILIYTWRRYARFLEKSNDDKSEFISFASHQIRTPLTSIKGFSSLLLEGDYGDVNPEAKDALQKILVRSNDVVNLIGQYLDKSKLELGKLTYSYSEFNLSDAVNQIVKTFLPSAQQAQINLRFETEYPTLKINADEGKVKEVIGNLIDNAIKYTPKGSIVVSLNKKGNFALLKVSDTGIGMNPVTIGDLFKKFSRIDTAKKAHILGTGLGLYLAKVFTDAHNGRIWAESAGEGKGSQFYVELPIVAVDSTKA